MEGEELELEGGFVLLGRPMSFSIIQENHQVTVKSL